MAKETIKILLIEDDEEDLFIIKKYLSEIREKDFIIERSVDFEDSIKLMLEKKHDIYMIDYSLGAKTGIDYYKKALSEGFDGVVIFLTGNAAQKIDQQTMEMGSSDYLVKDNITPEILERSIRYALNNKKLIKESKEQKEIISLIMNSSPIGICVLDKEDNILFWNSYFIKMFGFKEENLSGKLFDIIKFEENITKLYEKNYREYKFAGLYKNKTLEKEGRVICENGNIVDCIVKLSEANFINGKEKTYKIFTFTNIFNYVKREKRLKETINKVQSIMEKYAEKSKNAEVFLDLSELEIMKIDKINELS